MLSSMERRRSVACPVGADNPLVTRFLFHLIGGKFVEVKYIQDQKKYLWHYFCSPDHSAHLQSTLYLGDMTGNSTIEVDFTSFRTPQIKKHSYPDTDFQKSTPVFSVMYCLRNLSSHVNLTIFDKDMAVRSPSTKCELSFARYQSLQNHR